MHLQRIVLTNFKNYGHLDIGFARGFNCFFGNNGMGKTNLLDAIYFLCMAKSHFNLPDQAIVRTGADFLRLEGLFERLGQAEKVVAKSVPRKMKTFERGGVAYERLSEHIGVFPVVFIAPDDAELLMEGSEARRRFMDNTLCQTDPLYLRELILYNRVLQQRNALLRQTAGGHAAPGLLEIYDRQLLGPADYIYRQRQDFVASFREIFLDRYAEISRQAEIVEIVYRSAMSSQSLEALLQANLQKDIALQRTTAGPHRDDLDCLIGGLPVKRFASQGQRKSFLLALKLAQYAVIHVHKGFKPLLLLDDLFDKLDPLRTASLLELLAGEDFGQVFITDTQESRIAPLMPSLAKPYCHFRVQEAQIALLTNAQ
ncbi:MAG: DNA replication/repair protein RecF [Saprospiraceae bacterium]